MRLLRVLNTTFLISRQQAPALRLLPRQNFSLSSAVFDSSRLFTKKHEWISVADNVGTIGVSKFAQESLGDVVYVDALRVGSKVNRGDSIGVIESVKAASDVYTPVSGTIAEVNISLADSPGLVNKSTYDRGWIIKVELSDKEELNELMDEESYEKFCKEEQDNAE